MKKTSSRLAKRIARLRRRLGLYQAQFAIRLGVTQATVSAWEKGDKKRAPSAEAFFRLGSLAASGEDKIYFWKQAGLDEQSILEAAESISEHRRKAAPGEITKVPVCSVAGLNLEMSDRSVPLPSEFIPNPGSTVCLHENGLSGRLAGSAPHGLYIVDRSRRNLDILADFLYKVVVLRFAARDALIDEPSGIYVGRVWMQAGGWRDPHGIRLLHRWSLALLSSGISNLHVPLCTEAVALPFEIPDRSGPSRPFNIVDLREWLADHPEEKRISDKAESELILSARVPPDSEVLGEVIGRLSRHLGGAAAK